MGRLQADLQKINITHLDANTRYIIRHHCVVNHLRTFNVYYIIQHQIGHCARRPDEIAAQLCEAINGGATTKAEALFSPEARVKVKP